MVLYCGKSCGFAVLREVTDASLEEAIRLYAGRAAGSDRHHRRLGGAAVAGRAIRSRGGPPDAVHEQSKANRTGLAELPRRIQPISVSSRRAQQRGESLRRLSWRPG